MVEGVSSSDIGGVGEMEKDFEEAAALVRQGKDECQGFGPVLGLGLALLFC